MRRVLVALPVSVVLALAVGLTACGGGISTPAEYKQAAAGLLEPLAALETAAKTARTGSDPPEFGRNLATLQAPLAALREQASALKVKDPALAALHESFTSAIDSHVNAVGGILSTVTTTPLKDSKDAYQESEAAFDAAVAAWRATVSGI
jgi:hypothetical protein